MAILDHPQAQTLLADAIVSPTDVRGCADRLTRFLQRYLPLFGRSEQRHLATMAVQGRLSGLERKTSEPIARQAHQPRRALQRFVGAGNWSDELVLDELHHHVEEQLADPQGVMILDPSAFPKKGDQSCGVQRQWCGRLGKTDNCQVGVFLAYAGAKGHTLLDHRLYLPQSWADDPERRLKCHVPDKVTYQPKWQIALQLLRKHQKLPHSWVTGDDELGRVAVLRATLRQRKQSYVLDVPCNTLIRLVDQRQPRRKSRGRSPKPPFGRVDAWAHSQPESSWQPIEIRAGEKGPLRAWTLTARVQTRTEGRVGAIEKLVVIKTEEASPRTHYTLCHAKKGCTTEQAVRVHAQRHRVEESLQTGKGEVGLGEYEVRSWQGWHHHMTLCVLALWFVILEQLGMGKKNPGHHRESSAGDLHGVVEASTGDVSGNRVASERSAATQ